MPKDGLPVTPPVLPGCLDRNFKCLKVVPSVASTVERLSSQLGESLSDESLSDTTKSVMIVSSWLTTQLEQATALDKNNKEQMMECHGLTFVFVHPSKVNKQ